MKVIKAADGETKERTGETVFEPGAQVWGRETSSPETSKDFTSGVISFAAGARTVLHTHSSDQLLYVVSGIGKVGTPNDEYVITSGDVVLIPAGEWHWHGAGDTGSPMSHLMVTRADSETKVTEVTT
jgi:quercetin dioxygenase-like cupin family protein